MHKVLFHFNSFFFFVILYIEYRASYMIHKSSPNVPFLSLNFEDKMYSTFGCQWTCFLMIWVHFIIFQKFCVYECISALMYVYHECEMPERSKRVLSPLKLESQIVVSYLVGDGNQI